MGLPSFPSQGGTASLLLPEAEVPDRPQNLDAYKRLVSKHLASCLAERAAEKKRKEEVRDVLGEHFKDSQAQVLQFSSTLRSLGDWSVIGSRSEACALVFDAGRLCEKAPDDLSLSELQRAWKARHLGVPKQTGRKKKAFQESACWKEGCCTCKRSGPDPSVAGRLLWGKARTLLQSLFQTKFEVDLLLNGEIVYIWIGKDKDKQVKEMHLTHVSLQYLRPWRSTLLSMEYDTEHDRQKTLGMVHGDNILQSRSFSASPGEADLVTLKVSRFENHNAFNTATSFCLTLDRTLSWTLGVMRLSQRSTPFIGSAGKVRVWLVKCPSLCWLGETEPLNASFRNPQDRQAGNHPNITPNHETAPEGQGVDNLDSADAIMVKMKAMMTAKNLHIVGNNLFKHC